ncbi:hypothetical protein TNCV_3382151 [Trichonephila clavipes]|nr:hypothetical protein TNCV_3382151 [Trichonephila clavipes]
MTADYDKVRVIGSGTFGNVWLVKSKLSRHSYVLKEINLPPSSELGRQEALNEVAILSKCNHKHIIRYKDTVIESDRRISIIMEYAEGDLKSQNIFLTRHKHIKVGDFGIARMLQSPEDLAKTAIGTPYYLSPEIYQRKPYPFHIFYQNIEYVNTIGPRVFLSAGISMNRQNKKKHLFNIDTQFLYRIPIKIELNWPRIEWWEFPLDLCERILFSSDTETRKNSTDFCNSLTSSRYNYKSDIWALGCLLFEMAALEHAFKANDFLHLVTLILNGKRKELPRSPAIQELVNNLLQPDPEKRPSTEEILAYPFLQPYLSGYMLAQNSLKSYVPRLISPIELPQIPPMFYGRLTVRLYQWHIMQ